MEQRMDIILNLLGFINGNQITDIGKAYINIQYIDPDEFKFILLCIYKGIRGADALDMILAKDISFNKKGYSKVICDTLIEGCLDLNEAIQKPKIDPITE